MSKQHAVLTPWVIAALGVIGMLGPFGTDTYTPALPSMSRDLNVSMPLVQLTLAAFTIGMAVGQFVAGSLSDRIGRRAILLGGGTLVALAALAAAFAPNVYMLIALCAVMGLASAGGITGGRAVVADLVDGVGATRPFTILGMVVSLGPILGPIGGALVLSVFGNWRAIFVALAVFAVIGTIGVLVLVPESLPHEKRHRGGLLAVFANAGKILGNRQYISHALVLWLTFGIMFAYISTSSFIVQENLGLTPGAYATSFAVNGIGVVVTSFITARLAGRVDPKRLLLIGVIGQCVAVVGLVLIWATQFVQSMPIFICLFVLVVSMGFVYGPVTALAMVQVRFAAGTAVALLGSIQFASAAISASIVGVVSQNAFTALVVVASCAEVLVLATVIAGAVIARRNPQPVSR